MRQQHNSLPQSVRGPTWTLTSRQLMTSTMPTTSSNTRPSLWQLSAGDNQSHQYIVIVPGNTSYSARPMAVAHRMCRTTNTLCPKNLKHNVSQPQRTQQQQQQQQPAATTPDTAPNPHPRFAFSVHCYHTAVLYTGQVTASEETVDAATVSR